MKNINGTTILYGEIKRLGGVNPKILILLTNGDLRSFDITKEVAQSIGHRIYTQVGLRGDATWSYPDNKLLTFKVECLTEYIDTPVLEAFAELRQKIGKYWDEIEDINTII